MSDPFLGESDIGRVADAREIAAITRLEETFNANRSRVFFSRQLEVWHENELFHWITNRGLRDLVARGTLISEVRALKTGGSVTLMWHRSYRYPRRDAARVVALVEEYADPNIGAAIGLQGEYLVLEGFARHRFLLAGREAREYHGVLRTPG
jgi:hypothetical protein